VTVQERVEPPGGVEALGHEVVAAVIPGFRNQTQVETNLSGWNRPLTKADVDFTRKVFAK